MVQKQNDRYESLDKYMREFHEKNRKRVRTSGIVLILLPVILGLIRWFTDSDKSLFLFIWVLCMFALSAYLVSVEYMDHTVQKRMKEITGLDEDPGSLLTDHDLIPDKVIEAIGTDEEGGDE